MSRGLVPGVTGQAGKLLLGVRNPLLTESGSEGKAGLYICCYLAIGQTKYSYLKQIISKVIDRAV